MIEMTQAVPADAFELQLREEDQQEVSEGWREKLAKALEQGNAVAFRDQHGLLVALGGVVVTQGGQEVSPWLLCAPEVSQHKAFAWKAAKRFTQHLRGESALVYNFIPKTSHANRRFVQALGYRILPSPRDGFDFFYLPPHV